MRIALGSALGIGGLCVVIVSIRKLLLAANPLQDQAMSSTLVGLCVLFFGVTISLPSVVGFRQRLFLALTVSCMALLFDWMAFVPRPREFHAGASAGHPGGPVNSDSGRGSYGSFRNPARWLT
jgi:hypothetical protein